MLYREIKLSNRKPEMTANVYFYIVHSGGLTYGYYNGYLGHMETHLETFSDHTITWLEPESEWKDKED